MEKLILIGQIVKPQGIKGEVKINPYTSEAVRFNRFKEVYIDGKPVPVEEVRQYAGYVFMSFKHIKDRNAAELMRGKEISVTKSALGEMPEGKYLIQDIIGSKILADGAEIGKLVDILQNGAADVYVVEKSGGGEMMFPAIQELILKVDTSAGIIEVDPARLQEVAVDED